MLKLEKKFKKIWIKINSGMNRLGFKASSLSFSSDIIEILNQLRVACSHTGSLGWMTHFAVGESTKFCVEQEEVFKKTINLLGFRDGESISYSNSDAIIHNSKFCSDWVRPGILLYGAPSSLNPNFDEEVLECVTTMPILAIRDYCNSSRESWRGRRLWKNFCSFK